VVIEKEHADPSLFRDTLIHPSLRTHAEAPCYYR
jgi:hypothetical protein